MERTASSREVRVGAAQFSRRLGDVAYNVDLACRLIREAHAQGAELIALPELFSTGYFPAIEVSDEFFGWAETTDGPTIKTIATLTHELGCFVAAPIFEIDSVTRTFYNTAVLVGPAGVIGIYRKRHVGSRRARFERHYFAPGNLQYPVYQLPFARVGMSICYDRQFPETFRHMALRGADIALSLNNVASARGARMWPIEAQSAANWNAFFVVVCNATAEPEADFFGQSMIVDPFGEVVASCDDTPGVLVRAIDLGKIAAARTQYGPIRDCRLEDFGLSEEDLLETRRSRLGFI